MKIASDQLRDLLARDETLVRTWERGMFDLLTGDKADRLVLCGAGGLGRKTLAGLRCLGIEPMAFADNNPDLRGQSVEGVHVYGAKEAAQKFGDDAAFVVTIWGAHGRDRLAQRKQEWEGLGCRLVVSFRSLFWRHPAIFLPHYACGAPHEVYAQRSLIASAAELWSDDASRAEFVQQIRWRTELDFDGLSEPVSALPYFPRDIVQLREDECFVDCGAFDGDTLRDFLSVSEGKFVRYWALEPDPTNFSKLSNLVQAMGSDLRGRIDLLPLAAAESSGRLRFTANATAGSAVSEQGTTEVEACALDLLLVEATPTFLKMDIEGGEPAALRGARQIIGRCRPIIAISVYHLSRHLWEIPLWLAAGLSEYNLFLRPHDREGWDLVCYAIPRERTPVRPLSWSRLAKSPLTS